MQDPDNDLGIINEDTTCSDDEISKTADDGLHIETEEQTHESMENEEHLSLGDTQSVQNEE
jgi:hypothetical protein